MSRRRHEYARTPRPSLNQLVEAAEGGDLDALAAIPRLIDVEHAEALQVEAATASELSDVRPEDVREDRIHPDPQQRAEDAARWRTEPYAALASAVSALAGARRIPAITAAESRVVTLVRTLGGSVGPLSATVLGVVAYGKDSYGDGEAPFLDVAMPSGVRRWWVVNASALVLDGDVAEEVETAKSLDAVVALGFDILADWRR